MEAEKLIGEQQNQKEHRTQNCIENEQTSVKRRKRKKKDEMPMEKKKKVIAGNPKAPKSKSKKVASDTGKNSRCIKRKRTGMNEIYDDVESKFTVMERAAKVLASMEDGAPYFLKCMLPSNVTYSFWLIIPRKFGSLHLPSRDSTVILVDEWGKEYKTTYLIDRNGLSAGWRGFSMSHRLLKGDILIFRLIGHCKLKVHIVRVHGLDVVNAAACLMNLDAFGTMDSDPVKQDYRKRKRTKKYADCSVFDAPRIPDKVQEKGKMVLKSDLVPVEDQSENTSDGFGSEVLEGSGMTDHLLSGDHHHTEASFLHEHPCEGVVCR
nr:B3 domain-containing protein Os06g0194400-like isoform X1 [Coffea arabica]